MKNVKLIISIFLVTIAFVSCDSNQNTSNNDETTILTIIARNADNTPINGAHIVVKYIFDGNENIIDFGYTSADGIVSYSIPSHQEAILNVYNSNNELNLQQTIPAFHDAESTLVVIVPSPDKFL
jgi:hypothetical protein